MDGKRTPGEGSTSGRAVAMCFGVAAVFGMVHGLFSVYWGFGGSWLSWSLGERLTDAFEDRRWVLLPVGLVKIAFAVAPSAWWAFGARGPRLVPWVLWAGAGVLVLWGGLNTLVGQLVLAGVVRPGDGFDRDGMVGHAWLWDPLFLAWGGALLAGLLIRRRPGRATERADGKH